MDSGLFTKRAKYWISYLQRIRGLEVNSKKRDLRSESVLNEEGLSERGERERENV